MADLITKPDPVETASTAPVQPPTSHDGLRPQPPQSPAPVSQQVKAGSGKPRVVIVGAGFGGMSAARALRKQPVEVTVVDRNNYHGFWPLLYQVATAGLEPESIGYPVRGILRKVPNASFQMAEVRAIDFEAKQVITDADPLPYDYLVLAAGSANNYFGNDELAQYTFGMKDIAEAEALRNHVLGSFEKAAREVDPQRRAALLTFVIVGGGPTGVELAGAFAELIRHTLNRDYPMLDVKDTQVMLVEALDKILQPFHPNLQKVARKRLEQLGVKVRTGLPVASVEADCVSFKDGSQVQAHTVIWAAGVRAATIADDLGVEQGRGARVKVTPQLNLDKRPEVFVIGDMAYLEGYKGGSYPMVAPVAIQQGKRAAQNILAQLAGKPLQPFEYFDKGQMATIGRSSAILEAFGVRMSGFLAWIGWLFIHLISLIGFRNRLIVLANWAYNYFTYDRGVRIITRKE